MMADAIASRLMEAQAIMDEMVRFGTRNNVLIPPLTTLYVLAEGLDRASLVVKEEKQESRESGL